MDKTKTPNVDVGETARVLSFNSCENDTDVCLPSIQEQTAFPSVELEQRQSESDRERIDLGGVKFPELSQVSVSYSVFLKQKH